jgi:hypothetical protein
MRRLAKRALVNIFWSVLPLLPFGAVVLICSPWVDLWDALLLMAIDTEEWARR